VLASASCRPRVVSQYAKHLGAGAARRQEKIESRTQRVKQILQSLRTGGTEIAEVPCPAVRRGQVRIRTARSLVSVGTERMLVEFGKAGWIDKARQQPDRVRMVLDKVKTDGLMPTLDAVLNKLDQPLPLGYCNAGTVLDVGAGVAGFAVGDRVASNGKHAEVVSVPVNLCARIPDGVSFDEAAFAVVGAIGLQGIRLVQPTLGEAVVVTGLGLIGLVTVQLLRAHGCRVLGIDFDPAKLAMARRFGAEVVDLAAGEDPVAAANTFSRGRGVDAVIITASTKSSEPVHQAAVMSRKRGRIVLVGVTGLELSRADFFEKELSFQVSCSYGPGRYDADYEERGFDYPVGFVRWTEQRNFEAVLDMMADKRLDVTPLISHRFPIDQAAGAYELVGAPSTPSLGILLEYPTRDHTPDAVVRRPTVALRAPAAARATGGVAIAVVGSGNYATAVLIPAFRSAGARLVTVASSAGVTGLHAGRKHGFEQTTTDTDSVFVDPAIDAVVITTRHDSHADLVEQALAAGKHVFVEKPLALTLDELARIERARLAAPAAPLVMVGFNRRFAPQVQKMKALLSGVTEPKAFVMTVNAGAIPPSHWTQDAMVGGGRIVGEACHFIDLLRFLAGAPISGFEAMAIGKAPGVLVTDDKASITLRFEDGSLGTILYLANGHKSFPKERLELFAAGRILQLDNFRTLTGYGWPGFKGMKLWRQDKGQSACAAAFVHAVEHGGPSPIPFDELLEVGRATIGIAEALR
jgi:predicted dehydrogenase/NADPH:quinone reductase-like Zn-dependent oxidoreductase